MAKEREKRFVIRKRISLIWAIFVLVPSAVLLLIITYGMSVGKLSFGLFIASMILFVSGCAMTYLSIFAIKEKIYTKKYFYMKYLSDMIEYDKKFVRNTIYTWVLVDGVCVLYREGGQVKLFILKQEDNPEIYQQMKLDYSKKRQVNSIFQYIRYQYFEEQY
ncbi:hypothetical protein VNN41_05620 [Lactococcus garvieae]|uniref:hypothetical protein n=1 Tax=Lactococcus garvieae TaxID=1363 RepID=UPI00324D6E6B